PHGDPGRNDLPHDPGAGRHLHLSASISTVAPSCRSMPAEGAFPRAYNRPPMRTLYRAHRVLTLSYPTEGEWLLVDERHVQRVGAGEPPDADRTVELPGTTIVPGFIDSHVHLTGTGVHAAGPDLEQVRSGTNLVDVLNRHAESTGGAALAHGFDETSSEDPAFPTIEELDGASSWPLVARRQD